MFSAHKVRFFVATLALFFFAAIAAAEKLKLKDGRVIEGVVIPQPPGYWVKSASGEILKFDSTEVASVEKGSPPVGADAPSPSPAAGPSAAQGAHPVAVSFSATKSRCATVTTALAAVALWQKFIDDAAKDNADQPAAREELAKWKQLAATGAERIKGRWVGGDERKQILAKAKALKKEADDLIDQDQTLAAVKKLEESASIYPNSFETDFSIGQIAMLSHSEDKAIDWFTKALVIRPDNPEAMGNIALVYCSRKQYDKGIPLMKKALELGDRREIVNNLLIAMAAAPEAVRRRKDVKEAAEAAELLARRYDLPDKNPSYLIVPLSREKGPAEKEDSGAMWSGTGFMLSSDGLILTNRHVVADGKTLLVILPGAAADGGDVQKSAEVVVIDKEQDLALIRIKPDAGKKFSPVQLSPKDSPADGADCTVIGFPMIDRLGGSVKITRGIVSSAARQEEGPDVMIDAKVNPGNSGGPIFDRFGNVMAIVSMKTIGNGKEDSYGLGISIGNVRKFLAKNAIKLTPGPSTGTPLSAEEIAVKAKPSTVCILGSSK